jgi:hypothetical protein
LSGQDSEQIKQSSVVNDTPVDLIAQGKSKRLLEMRQKAMGIMPSNSDEAEMIFVGKNKHIAQLPDEFRQLRKLIDKQLQALLAKFPGNKKERFFQIRYGVSLKQLELMQITEIAALLKVKPIGTINLKQLNNLDYNGRPIIQSKA